MKRNKKLIKKLSILTIVIIVILTMSRIIYATTIEKTTITCDDENMYDALKSALSNYILLPSDVDKTNLTIKIPTDSIQEITEISLIDKQINSITGIEKLTQLSKINLAKNQISNIEPLSDLENITELVINDNRNLGDNLASVLTGMTSMKRLNISSTGLKNISFISNLNELQELEIANGSFNSLSAIQGIITLKKLDASGNPSIRTIQPLLSLSNLESLNLSNTSIDTLELDSEREIGIYNLTNLKELYVSGIDVETLDPIVKSYYKEEHHKDENDEWVGQDVAYLNHLEILDISYVNRNEDSNTSIPGFDSIKNIENIKKLYMQGNQIQSIDGIYGLSKLEEINLENNKIINLSGVAELEEITDENENTRTVVKDYLHATSIDLSNNEINDISDLIYVKNKSGIQYLDLQKNHIYNTYPLESVGGTIQLYDQEIDMSIYKKDVNVDQYIILLPIMQNAKDSSSKLYDSNANFVTTNCTLNSDPDYQSVDKYNVIIDKSKNPEDNIKVQLEGGIADGSIIAFHMSEDSSAIDSILFKDANLSSAVYSELSKQLEGSDNTYLLSALKVLNVNHYVISQVTNLDVSNHNISDISGLENFDNLTDINIEKNKGIQTIDPLQYCTLIEVLNASETSVKNNITAIERLQNLRILLLNNVGMTNINSINNLTNGKINNDEETTLIELDLSANELNNVNGIEKIVSLRKFTATKNQITNIPDITSLQYLERLTLYSNYLTEFPKIGAMDSLKYIFLQDNKINSITNINQLRDIIELDLSRNLLGDEDIAELKNIKVSKSLKVSGNNITDISNLKSSMSVSELNISQNRISDVSLIDARFQSNSTLTADTQKIALILEKTNDEVVSIDLPQIFKAAKTSGSYFYTSSNFETSNCTIVDSKVNINISEIGENIATVKIVDGKANDTIFSIVPPIKTEVTYSTNEWTNQNVVADIKFLNRNDVKIITNSGNTKYTFENNGEFIFEYVDEYGIEDSTIAKVTWIDKEKPIITNVEDSKTYTNSVKPIITDNNELSSITLTKNDETAKNYVSGTEINEIGTYTLIARDIANNETKIVFTIKAPHVEPEKKFTSEKYKINENTKIITNIDLTTKVSELKNNIESTSEYTIKDKNGKELSSNDYIGTGYIISTELGDYTVVVKGDLNGTGEIELNDLAQAQRVYLELITGDTLKTLAADLNGNDKIDLNDLAKLQKVFLGN